MITVESPSSTLLGRPSPVWCWTGCRCLMNTFTMKHSVDSGLEDWQSTMVFSLHQLQEKCSEQRQPLYIMFIDFTKAFDLVSRKGIFTLPQSIGCPPKLQRMITSFHEGMQGTVQYDDSSSDPFPIRNGVKQGCILAPTLFGIFSSLLLSYTFSQSEDSIYLCTRSDGSLFSPTHLHAKTKVWRELIRELLFADNAALTAHTAEALQLLISCFTCAGREFGLTICLKMTNIMGQDLNSIQSISISHYILEVVEDFTYLGSIISSNLSLNAKLNTQIGKTATAVACLAKRVWKTPCWPSTPRWRFTKPACSAHCSMADKHGLCTPPIMHTQCLPPALP